ncbi:MAG: flagellar motor switch protein FliN [Phycisphaerales bacterium]
MDENTPATPASPAPPSPSTPAKPAAEPADAAPSPPAASAAELAGEALRNAEQAVAALSKDAGSGGGPTPLNLPGIAPPNTGATPPREAIDLLADVNLHVKIELGRTRMLVEDVLRLGEGSVVELDKLAGDPVDIYVNDRPVARGEVLVLNDNFCVRINEIVSQAV